jgi:hypothetical protein
MESAGSMWRQVGEPEMAAKLRGEFDDFTKEEVRAVIDLAMSYPLMLRAESGNTDLDYNMRVMEYKIPKQSLRVLKFYDLVLNARLLRVNRFESNPEIYHPRVPANNVMICQSNRTLFDIDIYKSTDDWFWVGIQSSTTVYGVPKLEYFICDQLPGLLSMLTDFFERWKSNDMASTTKEV